MMSRKIVDIYNLGHPDLPDLFSHRCTLPNKDIHRQQLGGDLFRRVLLPWHVLILLDATRHTSSRTTSVGVDHWPATAAPMDIIAPETALTVNLNHCDMPN
jgi:hypothetical protein